MVINKFKRPLYALSAAVFVAASLAPMVSSHRAHAYGLVGTRSIKLSTSAASATSVTYTVTYTAATTGTVGGEIIDFCDNSPIVGDACTGPTGFDVGTPTVSNQAGLTGFTASAPAVNTLKLVNATPQSVTGSSTVISFDLTTAVNPSTTNHTFYARIITYDTSAHAGSYAATNAGGGTGAIDAGGIALSTANQVTVTSKVQERLVFCVYTGINCAAGGNTVTLGDSNGVLDPAGPYVDKTTKYDIATNASQGAAVRVKGDTLKTGSFSIDAAGASPASSTTGSEQFGLCTYESTATSTLTPASPYNNGSCSTTTQSAGTGTTGGAGSAQFGLDVSSGTNVTSTYGQVLVNKVAGVSSTGVIPMIGNISNTTEAGIYTTTLTFIATGIY